MASCAQGGNLNATIPTQAGVVQSANVVKELVEEARVAPHLQGAPPAELPPGDIDMAG